MSVKRESKRVYRASELTKDMVRSMDVFMYKALNVYAQVQVDSAN